MLAIYFVLGSIFLQECSCRDESSHLTFSTRDGKGWGSDGTSTFFDIALTALAFLSFGIFLLNLLLNALLFPSVTAAPLTNPGPILTMLTAGSTGTGGAIITGGTGLGRHSRGRRALFTPEVDNVTAAKLLVNFVTNSIETMTEKHECIPKVFCEGNHRAAVVGNGFQILVPIISASISYIGKALGLHNELPKHLNAILLGVSETNCQTYFQDMKCSR